MRSCLAVLFVALLASSTVSGAGKLSFRELDNSSTKEDVLKVFPTAQEQRWAQCTTGEIVHQFIDGEALCFSLRLEDYSVDNRAWYVSFSFFADGRLKTAYLSRDFGFRFDPPSEQHFSKDALSGQFESLYKLLNYKYSDPLPNAQTLSDLNDCSLSDGGDSGSGFNECEEWQASPAQKYERGQNHVILKLSAYRPSGLSGAPDSEYLGHFYITYEFVDVRSADRL